MPGLVVQLKPKPCEAHTPSRLKLRACGLNTNNACSCTPWLVACTQCSPASANSTAALLQALGAQCGKTSAGHQGHC